MTIETTPTPDLSSKRLRTDDTVARALEPGTQTIIGAVTFWSLHGIRISRVDLRALLENLGLGFAMPKDPKPQAALRMAVESVRRVDGSQVVFDRVLDAPEQVVYAMSSRAADEIAKVAVYTHKTRIVLEKKTGTLTLEDTSDEALLTVAARYREARDYVATTEFGTILVNAIRGRGTDIGLGGVNLRGDAGGVYFVPASNVERLNALAELLDGVGGYGSITVWPIPSGTRTIAQAVESAKQDFVTRIVEARKEVQEFLATLASDEKLDPEGRSIVARAKAFSALRARVDVYADLLGEVRSQLHAEIGAAQDLLTKRVSATLDGDFTSSSAA